MNREHHSSSSRAAKAAHGVAWAVVLSTVTSCSLWISATSGPIAPVQAQREGYSLFHSVVSKNRHADKILWVKLESDELDGLMTKVSALCERATETIERIAKKKAFVPDTVGLPRLEAETRKEIESTTRNELLGASGHEFEVRLLLTQMEATRYASHLSRVLATHESEESVAQSLRELSDRFEDLRDELVATLLRRGSDTDPDHD